MPAIPTRADALRRVKVMLRRDWNLWKRKDLKESEGLPPSDYSLRKPSPGGLGKNDAAIRALKPSIDLDFFPGATVPQNDLIKAKTVADLRDVIYAHLVKKTQGAPAAAAMAAPAAGGGAPVRITRAQALRRTKVMLRREWNLADLPASTDDLRAAPPNGLGKNNNQIRALEPPIETLDFVDVRANVTGGGLVSATTVADLRDVIWGGIPAAHQQN